MNSISFLGKLISILAVVIYSIPSQTEYRVFLLEIRNPQKKITRQIQSTMDPVQYSSVYPLAPQEVIMYQDTWLCPGNTAHFQQHCLRPTKD